MIPRMLCILRLGSMSSALRTFCGLWTCSVAEAEKDEL